jgi:hypothetical protein
MTEIWVGTSKMYYEEACIDCSSDSHKELTFSSILLQTFLSDLPDTQACTYIGEP